MGSYGFMHADFLYGVMEGSGTRAFPEWNCDSCSTVCRELMPLNRMLKNGENANLMKYMFYHSKSPQPDKNKNSTPQLKRAF